MSFFSALFGGANPTLNSTMSKTGSIGDFSSSLGKSDLTKGSNFYSSLLSGDSSKISQVLAPEISAAKTSNQQTQKTNAIFNSRSGGTAASNNASSDKLHSDITNMVGGLTGNAASSLMSSGQGLLGTALGSYSQQANMSQEQMQNWEQSILGSGITGAINYGESFLPVPHGGK